MKNIFFKVIAFAVLLLSCNSQESIDEHGHDHNKNTVVQEEHNHDHETQYLSITKLSKNYELYIEYQPLIIKKNNNLKIFITDIHSYKPVKNANINFAILGINSTQAESTETEHVGIYNLNLNPKKSGSYMALVVIKSDKYIDTLKIKDIEVYADEHNAAHASESENHSVNEIFFSKEQAWNSNFAVVKAERKPFSDVVKTSGEILPARTDEVTVNALHSGVVLFKKNIFSGVKVARNEEIVIISSKDFVKDNLENEYLIAKSNYESTLKNYERDKQLYQEKLITEAQYIESKNNMEVSKNKYNSIAGFYRKGAEKIVSPVNGYIKDIYVSEGMRVEEGSPIATVSKNQRLVVKADVSQKYFSKLSGITTANIQTPYNNKIFDIKELNGKILSYGKNTDKSTFYTSVFFEIDYRLSLIPGSFIEVYLKSKPRLNSIIIPVSALMEEQGNYYVFVQENGEQYVKKDVTLGSNDGINVEVTKGLKNGDIVVSKGAYKVKLAAQSSTMPAHSHFH